MSERKLVTIRKITNIVPIDGADSICSYTVDGWNVVDLIGKYSIGELVVYFEVDSWIPCELAPFLSKGNEPREYNSVRGERLRTIKLRKTLSQGLILPLWNQQIVDSDNRQSKLIPGLIEKIANFENVSNRQYPVWVEHVTGNRYYIDPESQEKEVFDIDLSKVLNVQKWEAPIPVEMRGAMKGNFPFFIPKTSEDRLQNLVREFNKWKETGQTWEVTEKLDGSSMTGYYNNGEFGVCSRNIDLIRSDTNTFWKVAIENDIESKLRSLNMNLAIQGELCGPGIQGNRYMLSSYDIFVFNVYDIDKQQYLVPYDRRLLIMDLGLRHVPLLAEQYMLTEQQTINDVLLFAEDKSYLNNKVEREGLVFKNVVDGTSFKAISNRYLLKFQ